MYPTTFIAERADLSSVVLWARSGVGESTEVNVR